MVNNSLLNSSQTEVLQSQLRFVCDKIEETITQYHKLKEEREKEHLNEFSIPSTEGQIPLNKQINQYNEQINNINYQLEMIYNIQRINQLESDLKEKKEKIEIN